MLISLISFVFLISLGSLAMADLCPTGPAVFQFDEPAGSTTITDESGLLVGFVNNPTFAIQGDGYCHGDEDQDTYVEFGNSITCLKEADILTVEARMFLPVVDMDYYDGDGNGIDDNYDFDGDPFTVLEGGRNSTQQRIFERKRSIQFTVMRGSWAGDYIEERAGKARVMIKYRVTSANRRACPYPYGGWSEDTYEGNGAWWKQVSSDIDQWPILANHCPTITNPDQADNDIDGVGTVCDCNDNDPAVPPNFPVRNVSTTSEYSHLQDAYSAAPDGDTIQSQAIYFMEDLYIDGNKSVSLEGGYDCDYAAVTGRTAINGDLAISSGTVTLENFEIKISGGILGVESVTQAG